MTRNTITTATIKIVKAHKVSDIPNPFQLSLTKVADMFTTVAIKSQPAYIPNDKGIIKCPLDFIDNNFSNRLNLQLGDFF